MAQLNFRIDDQLKTQAEAEFRQMGLTFSAAITLLCTQVVLKHKLPFAVEAAGAIGEMPLRRGALTSTGYALPGERFLKFIRENHIDVPADFKWSRAAANEREMGCLK